METGQDNDWAAQLAAAQTWWREAGVDLAFADAPTDWLAGARERAVPTAGETPAAKPTSSAAPTSPARIGGDRAHWPAALADFGPWWLTEPSLDPAPAARRVLPAGPAGAPLMVLVATPEPEDREALLSGGQGCLLDAILTAFGTPRAEAYLASALPSHVPLADWPALAANGMADVLAHHIALAAPQRLIVFGRDVSPLLGHDPAQAAQSSLRFNHDDLSVPLLYAPSLEALLERPALKRALWRRWLDWIGA